VAKFGGDDWSSDLGDYVAKEDLNYSGKTEWSEASIAGRQP